MVAFHGARSHYACRPYPDRPFVCRVVLHDIPNTVIGAIRAMPANCVAVVVAEELRHCIGIERVARRRGMAVLWRKSRRPKPSEV